RTQLRDWIARKAFYGGSAAPLAVRHPDKTAPLVISGGALMAWILMSIGTGLGRLASLVIAVLTGRRIARAMRCAET
ncbi:mycofactocin system glycosyltransferase, partial [Escherichia coli]|nr:mycofactocin system glycosyltransferase [Escherichia coli]